jgi:hypothetical protein
MSDLQIRRRQPVRREWHLGRWQGDVAGTGLKLPSRYGHPTDMGREDTAAPGIPFGRVAVVCRLCMCGPPLITEKANRL